MPTHVHENAIRQAQEDLARLIVPETVGEKSVMVSRPTSSQQSEASEQGERSQEKQVARGAGKVGTTSSRGTSSPSGTTGGSQQVSGTSDDVSNVGVLALLGTTSDRGRDDRVSDILGEGAGTAQDLDQVFSNLDKLSREGKTGGKKGRGTSTGREARGGRTTTNENLDGVLSDLGTAQSTSISRERDVIELDLSPLTQESEIEQRAVIVGARDPEQISQVVNAHKPALQYCYHRELKRNPNLKGKVVLRFTITPKGTVKDVKILSSTLDNEHVERCILSRVNRWDDFGEIEPSLGDATFRQVYTFGY